MVIYYKKASPNDAAALSKIAQDAKRNWGYPQQWIELWQRELTLTPDYISQHHVTKIFNQDELIGFHSIVDGSVTEVDHLWLTAQNQRNGFGSQIFGHIRNTLAGLGKTKFELVSEPYAKGFYEKMGGKSKRVFESKIPGRFLEIYEFCV